MVNKLAAIILFALIAGSLAAQDMPPLPPLPDQSNSSNSNSSSTAPASSSSNAQSPALPPLPGDQSAATTAISTDSSIATTLSAPSTATGEALPPLPGDQSAATPTPQASTETAASATPVEESATPSETKESPKKTTPLKPWQVSKYRPNVIFGGWVRPKGGNETSRLAWASQEVLNALLFKKYKLISPAEGKPEEGVYEGQGGKQWRQFTFIAPRSRLQVQVYLRQAGNKKVWLRVGPGEGVFPAETSLAKADKIRQADLTALHLIQKKFGRRLLARRVPTWEAPYRYEQETADY